MTGRNSARDKFLKFLDTDEQGFRQLQEECQPIVDLVESRIGGKDYWQVGYDELRAIFAAVVLMKPNTVIESGTGPGTTTTAILTALKRVGGKLISFDLGEKFGNDEQIPVGAVIPDDLREGWRLIEGDSGETLPRHIQELGPVDVFFHDSEHTYDHVMLELETFWKHKSDRFLIIIDNYNWSDAPDEFAARNGLVLYHISGDMCFIFRSTT